jgi:hypothetical protein
MSDEKVYSTNMLPAHLRSLIPNRKPSPLGDGALLSCDGQRWEDVSDELDGTIRACLHVSPSRKQLV